MGYQVIKIIKRTNVYGRTKESYYKIIDLNPDSEYIEQSLPSLRVEVDGKLIEYKRLGYVKIATTLGYHNVGQYFPIYETEICVFEVDNDLTVKLQEVVKILSEQKRIILNVEDDLITVLQTKTVEEIVQSANGENRVFATFEDSSIFAQVRYPSNKTLYVRPRVAEDGLIAYFHYNTSTKHGKEMIDITNIESVLSKAPCGVTSETGNSFKEVKQAIFDDLLKTYKKRYEEEAVITLKRLKLSDLEKLVEIGKKYGMLNGELNETSAK